VEPSKQNKKTNKNKIVTIIVIIINSIKTVKSENMERKLSLLYKWRLAQTCPPQFTRYCLISREFAQPLTT